MCRAACSFQQEGVDVHHTSRDFVACLCDLMLGSVAPLPRHRTARSEHSIKELKVVPPFGRRNQWCDSVLALPYHDC
jgi:hypothetical protein